MGAPSPERCSTPAFRSAQTGGRSDPGFTKVDAVAHSSDRTDGQFAQTLNLTDIFTTWVESGALLG